MWTHLFVFLVVSCPTYFGIPLPCLSLHSACWCNSDSSFEQGFCAISSNSEYECMHMTVYIHTVSETDLGHINGKWAGALQRFLSLALR